MKISWFCCCLRHYDEICHIVVIISVFIKTKVIYFVKGCFHFCCRWWKYWLIRSIWVQQLCIGSCLKLVCCSRNCSPVCLSTAAAVVWRRQPACVSCSCWSEVVNRWSRTVHGHSRFTESRRDLDFRGHLRTCSDTVIAGGWAGHLLTPS